MNRTLLALASLSFVLSVSSIACSSDDDDGDDDSTSSSSSSGGSSGAATSSSSSSGAATSSSSSSGAATSSSSSGGVAALNGCTTYVDHTADAEVVIKWDMPFSDANACSKIKVGSKVKWDGNTTSHPLNSKGGDTPTPITLTKTGAPAEITFDNAGTFGFVCTIHSVMTGAIQVVE